MAKLVRRHPHVFAGALRRRPRGQLGAAQGGRGADVGVGGVPLGQPALALAAALQKRAARAGADVPAYEGLGGELWELVRRCREAGVDPEEALRGVGRTFRDALAPGLPADPADPGAAPAPAAADPAE